MARPCGHCGDVHDVYATVCPKTSQRIRSFTVVNEDELLVGSVVAERYHVRSVLGQGSTGTAFAVDHVHLSRPAVMKVLRPRYVASDIVLRVFHGEARSAWSVAHPCVAEVFDIGTLPDGSPFFVSERFEGESLAARVGREPLSIAAAVDMVMQLLSATAAFHARALLVRDIRPQNVFLASRRGCRPLVKLLDLGLARLVPLDEIRKEWEIAGASAPGGEPVGASTIPYYFSPERARGEHDVEPASDLFVAGVVLYEALTGTRPFSAQSLEGLLRAITEASFPPLARLRPDVPKALDELVARALAKRPRDRPAGAKEMQDELRGAFDGGRRMTTKAPAAPSGEAGAALAASMKAPPAAGIPILTPAEPVGAMQSERRSDAAALPNFGDAYGEDTATDRRWVDDILPGAVSSLRISMSGPKAAAPSASEEERYDEASADNPVRTARPESLAVGRATETELEVDIEFEAVDNAETTDPQHISPSLLGGATTEDVTTAHGGSLDVPLGGDEGPEEEETKTTKLGAGLRAQVDELERRASESGERDTSRVARKDRPAAPKRR